MSDFQDLCETYGFSANDPDTIDNLIAQFPDKNNNGRKPLKMKCPRCGNKGHHKTQKTHPKFYHYKNCKEYFESILGEDVEFRIRGKKCSLCQEAFNTIELPACYLDAMVKIIEKQ